MRNRKEDVTGKKFGRLTFVEFHEIRKSKTYWKCICECGAVTFQRVDAVKYGRIISCGCAKIEANAQHEDLTGRIFTRLFVMGENAKRKNGDIRWNCRCQCGTQLIVRGGSLKSGHAKSCGCIQRETAAQQAEKMGKANRTHGESFGGTHSVEYEVWHHMRQRCTNEKLKNWKRYGGRGIKTCSRWEVFENFLADMGRKPSAKHSLDRIDNDGDYTPENCRWAVQKNSTEKQNKQRAGDV